MSYNKLIIKIQEVLKEIKDEEDSLRFFSNSQMQIESTARRLKKLGKKLKNLKKELK